MKKLLFLVLAGGLFFSACSKSDDNDNNDNALLAGTWVANSATAKTVTVTPQDAKEKITADINDNPSNEQMTFTAGGKVTVTSHGGESSKGTFTYIDGTITIKLENEIAVTKTLTLTGSTFTVDMDETSWYSDVTNLAAIGVTDPANVEVTKVVTTYEYKRK